jgi:hypothetical protein
MVIKGYVNVMDIKHDIAKPSTGLSLKYFSHAINNFNKYY